MRLLSIAASLGLLLHCCLASDEASSQSSTASEQQPSIVASENEVHGLDMEKLTTVDDASAAKYEYQAQTSRLISLIAKIYLHKQVFIRELLANACDALDKLRQSAFGNAELTREVTERGHVVVAVDKEAGTITFTDTGIGMSRDELREYLGTIAKSGTAELLGKLKESTTSSAASGETAANLIGQFGVGFYSAFLVAERVAVASRRTDGKGDGKQWVWTAEVDSPGFTIIPDPRGTTLQRGTQVTLKLKPEDAAVFLDEDVIKKHMQTYASYYPYPIYLRMHKTVEEELPSEPPKETEGEAKADEEPKEEDKVEEVKEGESKKTVIVKKTVTSEDFHVNSQKPLWLRDPKSVSQAEYAQMYRTLFREEADPLGQIQFAVESGEMTFRGILFVPRKAPFDIYSMRENQATSSAEVHLYVRRAFVADHIDDLLQGPLSFVRGVVDSDDLPLNVSRESLLNNSILRTIRAKVTSKAIELFKELADAESKEDRDAFLKQYSSHLKLEIVRRENLRAKLAPLLRFHTTKTLGAAAVAAEDDSAKNQPLSLDQLVQLAKCEQGPAEDKRRLLYLTGSSKSELLKSPFLEGPRSRDISVILAIEAIDEQCFKALSRYGNLAFQNVAQSGFDLPPRDDAEKETLEGEKKRLEPLVAWLKQVLGKYVDAVVLTSTKLVSSPFAVVANEWGLTGHVERLYLQHQQQQQSGDSDPMLNFMLNQKKRLEVNPKHPTIDLLAKSVAALPSGSGDDDDKDLRLIALSLYESALLSSGFPLHHPDRHATRVERMAFRILGSQHPEAAKHEAEEAADKRASASSSPFGNLDLEELSRKASEKAKEEGEGSEEEERVVDVDGVKVNHRTIKVTPNKPTADNDGDKKTDGDETRVDGDIKMEEPKHDL